MSVMKSLKIVVAATALAAFLAPTLPVGEAVAARAKPAAVAKKADPKNAKSVKKASKTASKTVQKKDQKDVKKAPAKKVAKKKTPPKKQTV